MSKGSSLRLDNLRGIAIPGKAGYGVAFDVGTTTVVGALVDLSTGEVLATEASLNPQSKWGSDVIGRITAVNKEQGLLKEMNAAVVSVCNDIIAAFKTDNIVSITAAGNSVMEHLLLGISPEPLSKVPYRPSFTKAATVDARSLGFNVPMGVPLYVFPLIGGFIGGDAVACALSVGLHKTGKTAFIIDIGTNSEVVLAVNGALYAASAAAGPAFEGGGLRYGMRAAPGAIQGVAIDGDKFQIDVIGGVNATGICGSGLIDAVAVLLSAGVIDKTGRMKDRNEIETNLADRIRAEEDGNAFVLHRGAKGDVTLSQQDVRSLQVAKAAIKASISMIMKKAKITAADIEEVFLAGAFGSHIKKEGLVAIGVLESSWADNVSTVGDAALEGAIFALTDEMKVEAESLAERAKYIPLSGSRQFEGEFMAGMGF